MPPPPRHDHDPLRSPPAAGKGEGGPAPKRTVFCPAYPALAPDALAADAGAVGIAPVYYRDVILPQWADSRRDTGGASLDWRANARRFARVFLTCERAHGRLSDTPVAAPAPGTDAAGGSARSGLAVMGFPTSSPSRTRAPSTDKYTVAAIRGSLDALDALVRNAGA